MDTHGYLRVAAAVPSVAVASPADNARNIADAVVKLEDEGVELAVFPEMCMTAYTCADLFHNSTLLDALKAAFCDLLERTSTSKVTFVVGMPVVLYGEMYNCAVFVYRGKPISVIPKSYIPNYNEFYEQRWWKSGHGVELQQFNFYEWSVPFGISQLVEVGGVKVGSEICEDLWVPKSPGTDACLAGAEVIVNLSASDAITGKFGYLSNLVCQASASNICGYVYSSAGFGESSTDLVFDGIGLIASNGKMLRKLPRWQKQSSFVVGDIDILALRRDRIHIGTFGDCAYDIANKYILAGSTGEECLQREDLLCEINPMPFVPSVGTDLDDRCSEIINIQSSGLERRLVHTHCKKIVVGISGGLDSTLALLVAVHAFDSLGLDRKGIIGVTMPGFGTTGRTHDNAVRLMQILGVTIREISIVPAVRQHFSDIGHDASVHDVTYENAQARQRTYLLMDIANQAGGMVLGTGDLSELALGWATYNGDHMSMYGVNAGVPKTLVKHLVGWFASNYDAARNILLDIIDTPISPELIPANADGSIEQKTEDLVGPYELHDFFLYYMLRYGFDPERVFFMATKAFAGRYDREVIKHWLKTFYRRFFAQQFKRSCLPDGPKVGSVCLSPRGDWRMPSDACATAWLHMTDRL